MILTLIRYYFFNNTIRYLILHTVGVKGRSKFMFAHYYAQRHLHLKLLHILSNGLFQALTVFLFKAFLLDLRKL